MKKLFTLLISVMLLRMLCAPAAAATVPVITQQPQNAVFCEHGIASYSVTVKGEYLNCTWYLRFNGEDYNISDTSGGMQPWEQYAGEAYGPSSSINGSFTTFTYQFNGIGKELDGCHIFAVVDEGHFEVYSSEAVIQVQPERIDPPVINIPPAMEIYQHQILDLYCDASSPDGSALSYTWYETATGDLKDIVAISHGSELGDTLRCDTSECGTRYYVCCVETASGGLAYSSAVSVTVLKSPITVAPPVITTNTLPDATVGVGYYTKLSCTDADAAFSVYYNPGQANELDKTGLYVTQHGELEGIPAASGSYTFTLCASGEGGEGYMTYTLKVLEAAAKPDEGQNPDNQQPTTPDTDSKGDIAPQPEPAPDSTGGKDGISALTIVAIVAAAGLGAGGAVLVMKKKR